MVQNSLPDLRRVEMPPPGDLRELNYVLMLVSFLIRVTNDLTKVTSGRKDLTVGTVHHEAV